MLRRFFGVTSATRWRMAVVDANAVRSGSAASASVGSSVRGMGACATPVAEMSGALRQLREEMDIHLPPERISEVTVEDVPDMMLPVADALLEVIKGGAKMRHKLDNIIDISSSILNGGQAGVAGGASKKRATEALKQEVQELRTQVSDSIPKAQFESKVDGLQKELRKLEEAAKAGIESGAEKAEIDPQAAARKVAAISHPDDVEQPSAKLQQRGVEREATPMPLDEDVQSEQTREELHAIPPRIRPTAESQLPPMLLAALLCRSAVAPASAKPGLHPSVVTLLRRRLLFRPPAAASAAAATAAAFFVRSREVQPRIENMIYASVPLTAAGPTGTT